MRFIESDLEKQEFLDKWESSPSIVFPVWEDLEKHPMNNSISFLYVKFPHESWIVSFTHNDCLSVDIDLSKSENKKWVYNKKGLLQTNLGLKNLTDINTVLFFEHYDKFPNGLETNELEVLTNFYGRNGYRDNLGKIIPIMRFGEVIENILGTIPKDIIRITSRGTEWVNKTMIPILSEVEQVGIRVDRDKFIDRWDASHLKHLKGDRIYTEYNPYTLTSRPSNRHGGINFGALNKKDGTRDIFIPREGNMFIQFDYDAYHVRLIGKMINYELPKTSAHEWLADQYGCSYDESKARTFKNLYGGISDEDKNIEFFKKTDDFIQAMWSEAQRSGEFFTPKHRRIKLEWIENPTPQKIFNYLLQATETENNIEIIRLLIERGYIHRMVLYTYDSYIFDVPSDIRLIDASKIRDILETFGFPVDGSYGENFGKL